MGKLSFGKMLDCLYLSSGSCSCFCMNTLDDEFEKKPLVTSEKTQLLRLKDVVSGNQTLAFQLKPKMVVLRVSMHCYGCARKVEKHISKMDGVTSYKVDLENKRVVVIGDVIPFEVLESVSKAHTELINYGFPIGLLPASVKKYTLNQTSGDFAVDLGGTCKITLPPDNYLATYSKRITGKIENGKIAELDGIRVRALFKWPSFVFLKAKTKVKIKGFWFAARIRLFRMCSVITRVSGRLPKQWGSFALVSFSASSFGNALRMRILVYKSINFMSIQIQHASKLRLLRTWGLDIGFFGHRRTQHSTMLGSKAGQTDKFLIRFLPLYEGGRGELFSFGIYIMDLEDKYLAKVSGIQSLSSSVQSTPEKNGHSDDASRSPELLQEFLKSGPRKELLRTCFHKDKKSSASSKSNMSETLKLGNKSIKKSDSRKALSTSNSQSSARKQNRKGENPMRVLPLTEQPSDHGFSNSWICKNSACRAVLSIDDTFCKRCSCCICHLFDDNKDPSLWLVCTSESGEGDYCGLSCHIECALQREKVGVVDLGQLMQLDGSYCCASCGKVSGILGCWKKQLMIAREARRLDVLCYRIYLSYRLLDETSRFKELHDFVKDAKAKLETEVGPVNGVSAKMARGIVSRLSVAGDIQKLCSLAIEKADEWLVTMSNTNPKCQDSRPAACKFLFEEVATSSVVIILIELSTASSDDIKGYKLWYFKSRDEIHTKEPISVFPRAQRRILISNLQPCTEYTFRIVSYTETGDLGHSEAKCFTGSVEIIHKNTNSAVVMNQKNENNLTEGSSLGSKELPAVGSSGFKVRDLGKILRLALAQQQGFFEGFCSAGLEKCCGAIKNIKPETREEGHMPPISRGLDLNVVSVPDLNEELTPPFESSRDEYNGCTLELAVEADDDDASLEIEKTGLARSHGSGDSQTWTNGPKGEVPAVDSHTELCRKRAATSNEETHDCDSTLINSSPFRITNDSGSLDENFEYCVKVIRSLECEGHINQDFRLKLLTWFSLRSTEQERRVVNTFIQTLIDDPSSLAGQLVDSFSDIISSKRPRNGFCSKLWH
ncbi:hypothetical protein V6N13_118764 [Hibiscus sabdariffa]